jgi:hypothetical protein
MQPVDMHLVDYIPNEYHYHLQVESHLDGRINLNMIFKR